MLMLSIFTAVSSYLRGIFAVSSPKFRKIPSRRSIFTVSSYLRGIFAYKQFRKIPSTGAVSSWYLRISVAKIKDKGQFHPQSESARPELTVAPCFLVGRPSYLWDGMSYSTRWLARRHHRWILTRQYRDGRQTCGHRWTAAPTHIHAHRCAGALSRPVSPDLTCLTRLTAEHSQLSTHVLCTNLLGALPTHRTYAQHACACYAHASRQYWPCWPHMSVGHHPFGP